jgi:hypothetical protein
MVVSPRIKIHRSPQIQNIESSAVPSHCSPARRRRLPYMGPTTQRRKEAAPASAAAAAAPAVPRCAPVAPFGVLVEFMFRATCSQLWRPSPCGRRRKSSRKSRKTRNGDTALLVGVEAAGAAASDQGNELALFERCPPPRSPHLCAPMLEILNCFEASSLSSHPPASARPPRRVAATASPAHSAIPGTGSSFRRTL